MKKLCDLTVQEQRQYMNRLAEATRTVVPTGCDFIVLVVDESRLAHFVASVPDANAEVILRQVGGYLRQHLAGSN